MTISIEIPKEFEEHFNNDRFTDSFKRICTDIRYRGYPISGLYERELIEMLEIAMTNAKVIK